MAGLPVITDPNNPGDPNILPTNYVTRSQGTTAQNWAGPVMSAGNTSVGNSSAHQAQGNPNPEDARAGFLAAGQPGGNPSDVIVPSTDGNGASGANIITVGAPAGTAGGGGYYPGASGAGITAVPDPMLTPGWTAQAKANEDSPVFAVTLLTPSAGTPTTGGPGETFAVNVTSAAVTITPTFTGGTSAYDVVATSALPTPAAGSFSLASATGVLTIAESTTAGTYALAFRVSDSSSPVRYATFGYTVVVTG